MRYFKKQLSPEHILIFNQWKDENNDKIQEWIANTGKTGDNLWGELGKTFSVERDTEINPKTLRNLLETALYEEQNGLCCYCGNSITRIKNEELNIWEYRHRAIEHFEPKNRPEFKEKTFHYSNLMLCCKESQRLKAYEVGRTTNGKVIQSFEDVAVLTNLPVSTIREHPKNKTLMERGLPNDDTIYVPNPPHCDDEKSKFDNKLLHTVIINPSKDEERINRLIFSENGEIDYLDSETSKDEVIDNTFHVLALNCKTLTERRQEKWLNAYINYNDVILPYWITEVAEIGVEEENQAKAIITDNINKLIVGKSVPNDELLLEPFYFVEVAFLKNLFNAHL